MGFGTTLYTDIYFSHKCYKSLSEVEADIDNLNDLIQECKERIMLLAFITEPSKFLPSDENDPIYWVTNSVEETIEALGEYNIELYKLMKLRDSWNNVMVDGKERLPDPEWKLWKGYKHTDFADGVYPDGTIRTGKED